MFHLQMYQSCIELVANLLKVMARNRKQLMVQNKNKEIRLDAINHMDKFDLMECYEYMSNLFVSLSQSYTTSIWIEQK